MQAAFYATPILYPLTLVPLLAAKIMLLNPMAQIIQDARYVLVTPATDTIYQIYGGKIVVWAVPICITLVVSIVAAFYFRARSKYFAEEV